MGSYCINNYLLRLRPGDLLVVATDGFSEAEDYRTRELYGYDRLLELVDRTGDVSAAEHRQHGQRVARLLHETRHPRAGGRQR